MKNKMNENKVVDFVSENDIDVTDFLNIINNEISGEQKSEKATQKGEYFFL